VNIVAVDDEQDVRGILQKKMSNLGHTSATAVNGLFALKKLRANNNKSKEELWIS